MKKTMLLAIAALMTAVGAWAQTSTDPVAIKFKTNIYNYTGASNAFHIVLGTTEPTYVDIDCGFGPVEYEVSPAIWDDETSTVTGTPISCQVGSEGIVTIYAEPALIDYFDAEGCYIESIDLGDCTNLDVLDLQHNELKALDLSKYTNLSAIFLTDNPFTAATPLVIGKNHPRLMILEVDIVDYISPDFDINTYSNLISFDAYANRTLTHLDPTGCPNLARLSVDLTNVSSLDLSKNANLVVLNIEDSRITSIDLSGCPALQQLYARNGSGTINREYKLSSLDLSHNPALTYLNAGSNNFKSIDLSKNPQLSYINLADNLLTDIDISNNQAISSLYLENNDMSFATLPLPGDFFDYTYQQRPMPVHKSYVEGVTLDFSSKVLRDGTTTDAVLYAYSESANAAEPLDDSYYTYIDGKIYLRKAYTDSLYVSFGNTAFPEARLTTSKFMVKTAEDFGKPTTIVTLNTGLGMGKNIEMRVGLEGASEASPKEFIVTVGNQSYTFKATTSAIPDEVNASFSTSLGGTIALQIPEGSTLTALDIRDTNIYSIDLSKATELRELTLSGCSLYTIDLSMNRNLRSLDLRDNQLRSLTLEGVNGLYGKNMLNTILLGHNSLSDITLNDTRAIYLLDLSYNNFSEFTYKDFDNIVYVDLSHNQLSDIDMTYMTNALYIDLSANLFESLTLPASEQYGTVNISANNLTFATLPYVEPAKIAQYVVWPQNDIKIPTRGPGIDLSAQAVTVAGHSTTFAWKKADGTLLTPDTDYTIDNGVTRFVNTSVGEIYCEMHNDAFPAYAPGLCTTLIKADSMPTNLLATFTTTTDGQKVSLSLAAASNDVAIYFDWDGKGETLSQYVLGSTYRLFDAVTTAGANVKVYTYEPSEKITVFSMSGASMSSMDATRMVDLICFNVSGAGLSEFGFPQSPTLAELTLDDNNLETIDIAKFPAVYTLSLNGNNLTSLDLSAGPKLNLVSASRNNIERIVTGTNPSLWLLYLSDNNLSEIDLSGLPALEQLALSNNNLSHIDLSANPRTNMLQLDGNKFTFSTLPPVKKSYYMYTYINQQPVEATCVDGRVDLSSQATVGTDATDYRWFIGIPAFDENNELTGEELIAGEEYTIENGVTTFLNSFTDVMCVMTNSAFPNLYLYTDLMKIEAGVSNVTADGTDFRAIVTAPGHVEIYTSLPDGTIANAVTADGRIVARTAISEGRASLDVPRGITIITAGPHATKISTAR